MDTNNDQLDANKAIRERDERTQGKQFRKLQKTIGLLSLVFFLTLGLFIWRLFIYEPSNNWYCGTITSEPQPWCGVSNESPEARAGKKLFLSKCASCHNPNMKSKSTGPALVGTEERWAEYPKEDLYKFIRNSQALIQEDHPRATALYQEYGSVMTAFPNLTDEEIEAILAYINYK